MIKKILKRGMAVTLAMSLVTGLMQTGFSPIKSVKKAEAADMAVSFSAVDGIVTKPAFNSNNFSTFDKDTGNTEYYFGKYGNAFYGVGKGYTDDTTWELVDTDSRINDTDLKSVWGTQCDGQEILDYTKGLINTYFLTADQKAMKSQEVTIDTCHSTDVYTEIGIGNSSTKLWPLSALQLIKSGVTLSSSTNQQVTELEKKMHSNSGDYIWSRSFNGCYSGNNYYSWLLSSDRINDKGYVTNKRLVSPAFALDLNQVLLSKNAQSGTSATSLSAISINKGAQKFLINSGAEKSDFDVPFINGKELMGVQTGKTYTFRYSGASINQLNGGTNYISAIIYDSTGKAVYYGNLGTIDGESGTAQITIPSDLAEGQDYTLALFEEEKCGAYKTDYASEPVYASFTAQNKMNLTYDVSTNGGTSTAPSSITEIEPDTVFDDASGVFDKTAVKPGWEFVGWNTDKDAREGINTVTMDSDKTLYAIFKKDLTVTFIDAGS